MTPEEGEGWTAYWFEATFDVGTDELMPVTSGTFITPKDKYLIRG